LIALVASIFGLACSDDDPKMMESVGASARIDSFSVSRLLVEPGESVEIRWSVRDTKDVSLFAGETLLESGKLDGNLNYVVDAPTVFRLEAGKGLGLVSRRIAVDVRQMDESALILSFRADPREVDAGEPTRLAWVTRGASQVEIFDGEGQSIPLGGAPVDEGSVEVNPDRSSDYRLVATGPGGQVERSVFVKVRGEPEVEVGVSATSILPGETVTLSWTVQDAVRVIVREQDGPVLVDTELGFEGSIDVQPARSTTYEVRGIGAWRDTIRTVDVDVAPRILSFELVADGPIGLGKPATLRWQTAGATELVVSNLEGAEERVGGYRVDAGSTVLPMGASGTFRLRAVSRSGEEVEETVSGEVLGLPSLAHFSVGPEVQSAQLKPVLVTVSWAGIENAERVKLETDTLGRVGIFEAPFEDGSLDLFLTETTEFTFTVSNSAGDVVRTAIAEVVPLPRVEDFTIFPSHAAVGEPVTISWTVHDAASVAIEWNGQALPIDPSSTTGTHPFVAEVPGSFRLVATNSAGGTVETSRALTIGSPQILGFGADRTVLRASDPLVLTWTTRGGVQLTILENGKSLHTSNTPSEIANGTLLIPAGPMDKYVYTLKLENGLGHVVERSLEVNRTDGPVIESFTLEHPLVCTNESPIVNRSVSLDSHGIAPTVRVEVGGNSIPLSGLQGSAPIPSLPTGSHQLTLVAESPGTRPDSTTATIEVIEETVFDSVEVSPENPEPGTDVTISWRAVCADAVKLNRGDLAPHDGNAPFQSIVGTGTFVPFTTLCGSYTAGDEGCLDLAFPSGFVFPFEDDVRSSIRVFANGFASFHDYTGDSWDNEQGGYPTSSFPWPTFAVFWEDLLDNVFAIDPLVGIVYELVGTAPNRSLIIEWPSRISLWWGLLQDHNLEFQLVLHENGTFEYRYGDMTNPGDFWWDAGAFAVIGYQNLAGTAGAVIANWTIPSGGLSNRSYVFDFVDRPPSGSFTIRPRTSQKVLLRAFGTDEVEHVLTIDVE